MEKMSKLNYLESTTIKVYTENERDSIVKILNESGWRFPNGKECEQRTFCIPCVIYLSCIKQGVEWDRMEDFPAHTYKDFVVIEASEFIGKWSRSSATISVSDLKVLNSDGRACCAQCSGDIKEPYPNIRYCPICE